MIFRASYDTTVKIVTPITFLILLSGIAVPAIIGGRAAAISIYYLLIPLIMVVIIGGIAYTPKYYSVDGDEINVHRLLLKPVKIKICNVYEVEVINKTHLREVSAFGVPEVFWDILDGLSVKSWEKLCGMLQDWIKLWQSALIVKGNI